MERLRDFVPVAGLVTYPLGMAVSMETGARNVREFVAWVKANPTASVGVPGLGGLNHFLGVQFAKSAAIDLPITPSWEHTASGINDLVPVDM